MMDSQGNGQTGGAPRFSTGSIAGAGGVGGGQGSSLQAYCRTPNVISFERAVDMRIKAIRETKCDGALIHINRSCKQWSGIMYEMEREIREKTGIPTAVFDGDQADPRNFSEAQYDTRVQGLIEVMSANKEGK